MNSLLSPSVRDETLGSLLALFQQLNHLKESHRRPPDEKKPHREWVFVNLFLGRLGKTWINEETLTYLGYGLPPWLLEYLRKWDEWALIEGHPLHAPANHPAFAIEDNFGRRLLKLPSGLLTDVVTLIDPAFSDEVERKQNSCMTLIQRLLAAESAAEVGLIVNNWSMTGEVGPPLRSRDGWRLSADDLWDELNKKIDDQLNLDNDPAWHATCAAIITEVKNRIFRSDIPVVIEVPGTGPVGGAVLGAQVVVDDGSEITTDDVSNFQSAGDPLLLNMLPRGNKMNAASKKFQEGLDRGMRAAEHVLYANGYPAKSKRDWNINVRFLGMRQPLGFDGGSAALPVAMSIFQDQSKTSSPFKVFTGDLAMNKSDRSGPPTLEDMDVISVEHKVKAVRVEGLGRQLFVNCLKLAELDPEDLVAVSQFNPTDSDGLESGLPGLLGPAWSEWCRKTRDNAIGQLVEKEFEFTEIPPFEEPVVEVKQVQQILDLFTRSGVKMPVALSGPPKTGKTWIAASVARKLKDDYGWNVIWVEPIGKVHPPSAEDLDRILSLQRQYEDARPMLLVLEGIGLVGSTPERTTETPDPLQNLLSVLVEGRHVNMLCVVQQGDDFDLDTENWETVLPIVSEVNRQEFLERLLTQHFSSISGNDELRNAIFQHSRGTLASLVEYAKKANSNPENFAEFGPAAFLSDFDDIFPRYTELDVRDRWKLLALSHLRLPCPMEWFERNNATLHRESWAQEKRIENVTGWFVPNETACWEALGYEATNRNSNRTDLMVEAVESLFKVKGYPVARAVRILARRNESVSYNVIHGSTGPGSVGANPQSSVVFYRMNDEATDLSELLALLQSVAPSISLFDHLEKPATRLKALIIDAGTSDGLSAKDLALGLKLVAQYAPYEVQEELSGQLGDILVRVLSQFAWAQEKSHLIRIASRWLTGETWHDLLLVCLDPLLRETEPEHSSRKFRLLLLTLRYLRRDELTESPFVKSMLDIEFGQLTSSAEVAAAAAAQFQLTDRESEGILDDLVPAMQERFNRDSLDTIREALVILREENLPSYFILQRIDRSRVAEADGSGRISELIRERALSSSPSAVAMFLSVLYSVHSRAAVRVLYPDGDSPDQDLIDSLATQLKERNDARGVGFLLRCTARIDDDYSSWEGRFSKELAETIGDAGINKMVWGEARNAVLYYMADGLASAGINLPDKLQEQLVEQLPAGVIAPRRRQWACRLAIRLAEPDLLDESLLTQIAPGLPPEVMLRLMCETQEPQTMSLVHSLALAMYPELAKEFSDLWQSDPGLQNRLQRHLGNRSQPSAAAEMVEAIKETLQRGGTPKALEILQEDFTDDWWRHQLYRERNPGNVMNTFNILDQIDRQLAHRIFDLVFSDDGRGWRRLHAHVSNSMSIHNPELFAHFVLNINRIFPERLRPVLESFWSGNNKDASMWYRFMQEIQFIQSPREQGAILSSLSSVGFIASPRVRRSLLRGWIGLDNKRSTHARISIIRSPRAVRHLLQGIATWQDGGVFDAIRNVNWDSVASRIRNGSRRDVNDGVLLLRMLTGLRYRVSENRRADLDWPKLISEASEPIISALNAHTSSWSNPRDVQPNPRNGPIDLARMLDVLTEWNGAQVNGLKKIIIHYAKRLLDGDRWTPYHETLINLGWVAWAAKHAGEALEIQSERASQRLRDEYVSPSVRIWAMLSLGHTTWRDEEFNRACNDLMEDGIGDRPWALAVIMSASLENSELIKPLDEVGDKLGSMLIAEEPGWLEVALDSASRSPKIAALIRPYLKEISEHLDKPYWSAHLEASRCKGVITGLTKSL